MKQLLIFLLLTQPFLLFCQEYTNNNQKPIQIYLCSRLTQSAREWNNVITGELSSHNELCIFRPQDVDLRNLTGFELDYDAFYADFEAILHADMLLVLPPYGRDCAWEIGWFCGAEKPTIAYIESEGDWVRDSMIMGGMTAIITNNAAVQKLLLENPLTAKKNYLIESKSDLGDCIKKIYYQK
jgi:nucleoside 2-deoxyribosyltransferase